MGNIELTVEVDGAKRVDEALTEGLEDGLVESGDWLTRKGIDKAKDRIRDTDRIWRRKLYESWDTSGANMSNDGRYTRTIRNVAGHAGVVEDGLSPGTTPPVQNIIEWVADNITPDPSTVAAAQERDLENWDEALQALAEEYSKAYVLTAFAVQQHLEKRGYEGIGFMEAAERYMSRIGPMVVHRKVEKHMERQLRQKGLK